MSASAYGGEPPVLESEVYGPIPGSTGLQGAQGAQGVQGSVGSQGTPGTQGAQGAQGSVGSQGTPGTQGAQGAQGSVGSQGTPGTQGAQGAQGSVGSQGTPGTQGAQGAQGSVGSQGAQGASGGSVVAEAHADTTIVNTTVETDACSLTIPAGVLAVGDLVRLIVWADMLNTSGSNVNYTFRLKIGATTVFSTGTVPLVNSANRTKVRVEVDILVESTTAQRVIATLQGGRGTGSNGWESAAIFPSNPAIGYGTSAEDTSTSKTVKLTVQMGTAVSTSDFVCHGATLQIVKKV